MNLPSLNEVFGIPNNYNLTQTVEAIGKYKQNELANQVLQLKMPYVQPMAEEDLQSKKLSNLINTISAKYLPETSEADIMQKRALASLSQAQAGQVPVMSEYYKAMTADNLMKAAQTQIATKMAMDQYNLLHQIATGQPPQGQTSSPGVSQASQPGGPGSITQAVGLAAPKQTVTQPLAAQALGAQTAQQTDPRTEQMKRYLDFVRLTKGEIPVDLETQQKVQQKLGEAQATIQAKELNDIYKGNSTVATSAESALNNLNQMEDAYNKAILKGPIFGKASFLDPNAQVAMKNAANLLVQQLGTMRGLGRLNLVEVQNAAQGLPSMKLSPEASKRVFDELRIGLQMVKEKEGLTNSISQYTNDPNVIRSVSNYISQTFNPIDSSGNIDESQLGNWRKFVDQDLVNNVAAGKVYLTPDMIKEMTPGMLKGLSATQKEYIKMMKEEFKKNLPSRGNNAE